MTWLATARAMILRHEGERAEPYDDATGLTIRRGYTVQGTVTGGVGHTGPWCPAAISVQYDFDLQTALADARTAFPGFDGLDGARKTVLLSMAFNMGGAGLAGFRKMLEALAHGQYEQAAAEMRDSKWYGQVGKRAEDLAQMMEHGDPEIA